MRIFTAFTLVLVSSSATFAGCIVPMPSAGVAGPTALLAAIGAVAGIKYLRSRRAK